jgi:hypothetical protein
MHDVQDLRCACLELEGYRFQSVMIIMQFGQGHTASCKYKNYD